MSNISFLLGAGFSIPDGYPTTAKINERLKKINQDEIHIHTSGTAWFLNGEEDLNSWSRKEEKLFIQKFLQFYNSEIIEGKVFHYEDFFDYYSELSRPNGLDQKSKKFFIEFNKQSEYAFDHYNWLLNFNETFNQLLASLLLLKWPESAQWTRPYQKNYAEFLELLDDLGQNFKVHIHSLNHDLLMERLFHTDTLAGKIDDGFEEEGSPYYSNFIDWRKMNKSENMEPVANYRVRIKRFTNKFSKQFCFYKLHGSIDNYVFNLDNKEFTTIKHMRGLSYHEFVKEIHNPDGSYSYHDGHTVPYPDFLSGTSSKILSYDRQEYYKPVHEHFIENLKNSKYLIIIGYGFGDSKINEYLIKHFLSDETKTLIDIDVKKPNSDILDISNVKFIKKSISKINRNEILELIGE